MLKYIAAVLIVAALGFGGYKLATKPKATPNTAQNQNTSQSGQNSQTAQMPKATGNIDDVANALVQGASSEQAAVTAQDDSSLVNSNSSSLNSLSQAYDENKF